MVGKPIGGVWVYSWSPYVGKLGRLKLFACFELLLLLSQPIYLHVHHCMQDCYLPPLLLWEHSDGVWRLAMFWGWLVKSSVLFSISESDLGLLLGFMPSLLDITTSYIVCEFCVLKGH